MSSIANYQSIFKSGLLPKTNLVIQKINCFPCFSHKQTNVRVENENWRCVDAMDKRAWVACWQNKPFAAVTAGTSDGGQKSEVIFNVPRNELVTQFEVGPCFV